MLTIFYINRREKSIGKMNNADFTFLVLKTEDKYDIIIICNITFERVKK